MTKDQIEKIEAHVKMAGNLLANSQLADEVIERMNKLTELKWEHRRDTMARLSELVQTYPTLQKGIVSELHKLSTELKMMVQDLPTLPDLSAPAANPTNHQLKEEEEDGE